MNLLIKIPLFIIAFSHIFMAGVVSSEYKYEKNRYLWVLAALIGTVPGAIFMFLWGLFWSLRDFLDKHTLLVFYWKFHVERHFDNMEKHRLDSLKNLLVEEKVKGGRFYKRINITIPLIFKRNNYDGGKI